MFGRRAGAAAAEHALRASSPVAVDGGQLEAAIESLLGPLERPQGENPYRLQDELRSVCDEFAPIIRDEPGLRGGLERVMELEERAHCVGAGGPAGRAFNPGWHTAQDLRGMLVNAEALFRCAIERRESRGAHARSDYPDPDPHLGTVNFVVRRGPHGMQVRPVEREPVPERLTEVIR